MVKRAHSSALCNLSKSDQERTEGEALAGLVLLSAFWTSTEAEPDVTSKSGKGGGVEINDNGEIIALSHIPDAL